MVSSSEWTSVNNGISLAFTCVCLLISIHVIGSFRTICIKIVPIRQMILLTCLCNIENRKRVGWYHTERGSVEFRIVLRKRA